MNETSLYRASFPAGGVSVITTDIKAEAENIALIAHTMSKLLPWFLGEYVKEQWKEATLGL